MILRKVNDLKCIRGRQKYKVIPSVYNETCFTLCAPQEQCDQIKSPNVYKSYPKIMSLEKLDILTPFQKLPKYVGDLGKLIVAKGFEKLPKVQ